MRSWTSRIGTCSGLRMSSRPGGLGACDWLRPFNWSWSRSPETGQTAYRSSRTTPRGHGGTHVRSNGRHHAQRGVLEGDAEVECDKYRLEGCTSDRRGVEHNGQGLRSKQRVTDSSLSVRVQQLCSQTDIRRRGVDQSRKGGSSLTSKKGKIVWLREGKVQRITKETSEHSEVHRTKDNVIWNISQIIRRRATATARTPSNK
jgi:hypothetical protein